MRVTNRLCLSAEVTCTCSGAAATTWASGIPTQLPASTSGRQQVTVNCSRSPWETSCSQAQPWLSWAFRE